MGYRGARSETRGVLKLTGAPLVSVALNETCAKPLVRPSMFTQTALQLSACAITRALPGPHWLKSWLKSAGVSTSTSTERPAVSKSSSDHPVTCRLLLPADTVIPRFQLGLEPTHSAFDPCAGLGSRAA